MTKNLNDRLLQRVRPVGGSEDLQADAANGPPHSLDNKIVNIPTGKQDGKLGRAVHMPIMRRADLSAVKPSCEFAHACAEATDERIGVRDTAQDRCKIVATLDDTG